MLVAMGVLLAVAALYRLGNIADFPGEAAITQIEDLQVGNFGWAYLQRLSAALGIPEQHLAGGARYLARRADATGHARPVCGGERAQGAAAVRVAAAQRRHRRRLGRHCAAGLLVLGRRAVAHSQQPQRADRLDRVCVARRPGASRPSVGIRAARVFRRLHVCTSTSRIARWPRWRWPARSDGRCAIGCRTGPSAWPGR